MDMILTKQLDSKVHSFLIGSRSPLDVMNLNSTDILTNGEE